MLLVCTVGVATTATTAATAEDEVIVVVVNKANAAKTLDRDELRLIFQTTKRSWSDGENVTPYNLPDDSSLRHGFDAAVLGLDPERVARYWIDRKIRGDAHPPSELLSTALVVKAVAKNKGAIGYVAKGDANDTVKVVARVVRGQVVAP